MMDSRRADIPSLPEDAAALRALVLATIAERDAATANGIPYSPRMTGCAICC